MSGRWSRALWLAKLKAVAVHVLLSAALVAAAFALILCLWFPQPLFITDGAAQGIRLIVLVDMILGPLLTFVVFNPGKTRRALGVDLGIIAAAQLAAYGAGLYSIHSVRIQAVAYYDREFSSQNARMFEGQLIDANGWSLLGKQAPYLVDVREPKDEQESAGVLAFGITEGLGPESLHFLYRPFAPQLAERAETGGYRLADLQARFPPIAAAARAWAADHGVQKPDGLWFFPIQGIEARAVLVLSDGGKYLGGFAGNLPKRAPPPGNEPATSRKPGKARYFVPLAERDAAPKPEPERGIDTDG